MFHQFDLALRRFRGNAGIGRGHGRAAAMYPPHATPMRRPALGLAAWRSGRSMPPAALRVLETTWRLWREPAA